MNPDFARMAESRLGMRTFLGWAIVLKQKSGGFQEA